MSRLARKPLEIPKGVEITEQGSLLKVKGPKGQFDFNVHESVSVKVDKETNSLTVSANKHENAKSMLGTTVRLLSNTIQGALEGFTRALKLVGVGYRAKIQGKKLELSLGFSHPVVFEVPEGITITTPSNTEILVSGSDKQRVGQIAANIREFRPPEPYKGKGVRYSDEHIKIKETKKK